MQNITKTFLGGKIVANDDVTLRLKENEILSIVGENGSGKSTLMNILFGMYKQDSGKIFFRGKEVNMYASGAASKYRIGMVHQHFHLVDKFTVLDNILIGQERINPDPKRIEAAKADKERYAEALKTIRLSFTDKEKARYKEVLAYDKAIMKAEDVMAKLYNKIALNINDKEFVKKQKENIAAVKKQQQADIKAKNAILNKSPRLKKAFNTFVDLERAKTEVNTAQTSNFGIINKRAAIRRFKKITKEYGIKLMYDQRIADLSVGDRQKVEILKVL
jgi:simple sugar transport system ATP-binding protein